MAKILAKYARRNNSDELPDRRELVEMDLFDTDRNPWPGKLGGDGLWIRYDFDPLVPFDAPFVESGFDATPLVDLLFPVDDRPCLALLLTYVKYDVESGSGDGKYINVSLEVDGTGGYVRALSSKAIDADGGPFTISGYEALAFGVLNPATFPARFRCWVSNDGAASNPVVHVSEVGASVFLLPAGLAALGGGWGGTGG
jgi:hypothetical protein